MRLLIIPTDRVEKLKSIVFHGNNILDPVKGVLADKEVFFLQASLMTDIYTDKDGNQQLLFAEVLKDFEVCEQKEIVSIAQKYYDKITAVEILPAAKIISGKTTTVYLDKTGKELNLFDMTNKTVLTAAK